MDHNNNNKSGQFDASLKLPDEVGAKGSQAQDDTNPAADLIRKKVEAAYIHEPDADEEIEEVQELSPHTHRSKHQEFIYNLTSSGRPLHEINTAWHEYYAGLTDAQKHEVWQEFYNSHAQTAHHPAITHEAPRPEPVRAIKHKIQSKVVRQKINQPPVHSDKATPKPATRRQARPASPLHSLLFGIGVGSITILIFLFGFFNERIIAPFIQPSRSITNLPAIITNPGANSTVGAAPEVIIPKINIEVPVVYGVTSTDDSEVQKALEVGVVHYADTALPGQDGNLVIVGHSSGNIFNKGQYKYVFSLLRKLNDGDTFYLQKDSKLYTYQVYKKEIVKPTDIGVLAPQSDNPATATLITCDPPGVSTNRLVVVGKQISPDPTVNVQLASTSQTATAKTATLPSDSPTLWSRLVSWFTH